MVKNSLKQKCFCRLDPSSSFHQGLQMWPKVDAEYSLHAIQRSWPRVLCSLMCCMLVVLLLWPKSLCWSWCQYTTVACWCWRRSNALVMLVLRIWLIMSLADFRLAALQSQECGRPGQQRHRFSHLASTTWWSWCPDGAYHLVMMPNTWWCFSPDDEAKVRVTLPKTDNFSETFQTAFAKETGINFKQLSKIKTHLCSLLNKNFDW